MKIMVTGSKGYLGRNICKYFNDLGNDVIEVHRGVCDLTKEEEVDKLFENTFYDCVIHCAIRGGNRTVQEDMTVYVDNINMYANLLKHNSKIGKFINIGSGVELEYIYPETLIEASSHTLYALSKKKISKIHNELKNSHTIYVWAVFSADEEPRRFIRANIENFIMRRPMIIHHDKRMDFYYMEDFLTLLNKVILDKNAPKTVNAVYERKLSLVDIAKLIMVISSDSSVEIHIQDHDMFDYIGKFTPYLTEKETIGMTTGIRRTYDKLRNILKT